MQIKLTNQFKYKISWTTGPNFFKLLNIFETVEHFEAFLDWYLAY